MAGRNRLSVSDVIDSIFNDSDSEYENDSDSDLNVQNSDSESVENLPHPAVQPNIPLNRANIRRQGQPNDRNDNNTVFDWQYYEMEDPYYPEWFPMRKPNRGILVDTSDFQADDYFKLFFPVEALELIATETNRYAMQFFDSPTDFGPHSRFHKWTDTSTSEIAAMIAIQISMGICTKPSIDEYWNGYWLTKTDIPSIMTRNRYQLLQTFLHFNDNNNRVERGNPGYNPLFKIQPLLDIIEPLYERYYQPGQSLSVDESMIKFKGRIYFRQYMPAKPTKWGFKKFVLCDSKTGYALRHIIYTGRQDFIREPNVGLAEQVVLDLCSGYENKNHIVFMDNYYSNPQLFSKLQNNGIGACGTVNPLRKHMPEGLKPRVLALRKGDDPVFYRAGDLTACAWHDTKRVTFLSTVDTNNTVDKTIRSRNAPGGTRTVEKPVMAERYNEHMAGVDLHDQLMGTYAYPHKCQKWYQPLFHNIVETALVNGYIIYKQQCGQNDKVMGPVPFRKAVIDGLLEGHEFKGSRSTRAVPNEYVRLKERHFIKQYDNKKYKPDCKVCASMVPRKRKQTSFYCGDCDTALCVVPCFELFHTYKDFKRAREALQ